MEVLPGFCAAAEHQTADDVGPGGIVLVALRFGADARAEGDRHRLHLRVERDGHLVAHVLLSFKDGSCAIAQALCGCFLRPRGWYPGGGPLVNGWLSAVAAGVSGGKG